MKNHFILLIILIIFPVCLLPVAASATSVSRTSLCDLEGSPGETIMNKITLTGNAGEVRSGYWEIFYNSVPGDAQNMDISSWIEIEPKEYMLNGDESIDFLITVHIPKNAAAGLWGATAVEAGLPGHSAERRTYIYYSDTLENGNVYTGRLIPVAVQVLNQPAPLVRIIDFISQNIIVTLLSVVIIILIVLLVFIKKPDKSRPKAE